MVGPLTRSALGAAFLQSAASLVDQGIELSHRGRFAEAGDKFAQAIAADPRNAEAHHLLGLVRQQDGRADAALASFRTAVKLSPGFAPAWARVCELERREAQVRDAAFDKALASCQRASALDPKDAEPHFHAGWLRSKLGSASAAVQSFQTAMRLDPKLRGVKYELALAYSDSGDFARAVPLLREVVASEPANGNARFHLGSALARQGDCAAAVPLLEAATESDRKYYLLSGCYKKLGRTADASAGMGKVKELRRGADARMQAKFLAAAATKKAESGDLDGAIASYREALALGPDPSLTIDLAVALLRKGDAAEVIRLTTGMTQPLARYQAALAHAKLGHWTESRAALQQAVKQQPSFVEAWYQLGVAELRLGNAAAAEQAFATAVKLRPDQGPLRAAWAEALDRIGKRTEAARERELAAKLTQ